MCQISETNVSSPQNFVPIIHCFHHSIKICNKILPGYVCHSLIVRKRLSQLRLGVLPLRVETDRYQRVKIDASERYCRQPKCTNNIGTVKTFEVENEFHFLVKCKQYDHIRNALFAKLSCPEFDQLNEQNKFCYMLTRPNVARTVGQFIIDAFDERPVKI